jgi:hypothetical protein
MDVLSVIVAVVLGLLVNTITEFGSRRVYRRFAKSPTPKSSDRFIMTARFLVLAVVTAIGFYVAVVLKKSPDDIIVAALGLLVLAVGKLWIALLAFVGNVLNNINYAWAIIEHVGRALNS